MNETVVALFDDFGTAQRVMEDLIDAELEKFAVVKTELIPAFNQLVREKSIDAIILKK